MNTAASDGSRIPRRVCEEYLNSDSYKTAIEKGTAIGTLTHRDRVLKATEGGERLTGVVGKDDAILLSKTAVSVLERVYLPDDPADEWVYGVMRILDEDVMDEKSAEVIKQVKGLLRNGIKLTTSSVIIG